jgi:hypothetical protein
MHNLRLVDLPWSTGARSSSVGNGDDAVAYIRAEIYRETVRPANSGTQNAPSTFMPYNVESVTVATATSGCLTLSQRESTLSN